MLRIGREDVNYGSDTKQEKCTRCREEGKSKNER